MTILLKASFDQGVDTREYLQIPYAVSLLER